MCAYVDVSASSLAVHFLHSEKRAAGRRTMTNPYRTSRVRNAIPQRGDSGRSWAAEAEAWIRQGSHVLQRLDTKARDGEPR